MTVGRARREQKIAVGEKNREKRQTESGQGMKRETERT